MRVESEDMLGGGAEDSKLQRSVRRVRADVEGAAACRLRRGECHLRIDVAAAFVRTSDVGSQHDTYALEVRRERCAGFASSRFTRCAKTVMGALSVSSSREVDVLNVPRMGMFFVRALISPPDKDCHPGGQPPCSG